MPSAVTSPRSARVPAWPTCALPPMPISSPRRLTMPPRRTTMPSPRSPIASLCASSAKERCCARMSVLLSRERAGRSTLSMASVSPRVPTTSSPSVCSIGAPSSPVPRAAPYRPTSPPPRRPPPSCKTAPSPGPTRACRTSSRTRSLPPKPPTRSCRPSSSPTSTIPRVPRIPRPSTPTPTSSFRTTPSTAVRGAAPTRSTASARLVSCSTSPAWPHRTPAPSPRSVLPQLPRLMAFSK
mmetsp:Transcript_1219/g.3465  ORF Transcript_1219/g.3465 Transcript_1219/m.3465 type:complete len:239 (-) Transcript_1219:31-747(-)